MSSNICAICKHGIGLFSSKIKIRNDEVICYNCYNKAGGISQTEKIKKMSSSEIVNYIKGLNKEEEQRLERIKSFKITRKVLNYIYIDENKRQWVVPKGLYNPKIENSTIYSYEDITSFELLEDGASILQGGLGSAVAGGLLFGGVGAVVGGVTGGKKSNPTCTNLKIKITLKDIKKPTEYITFISSEVRKNTIEYKNKYNYAQEVMSMLQIIYEDVKAKALIKKAEPVINPVDELKKFKELLDCGAITQNEYDKKKEELLKLI